MRRHLRLPMGAIAGALLGLIALLATLQYRWLGQISGAERDRMKATLSSRATAFGQDVDRELTRAYLLFQIDALPPDVSPVAGILARYERWQATARFPRLLKEIYLVPSKDASSKDADSAAALQRFDVTSRMLEPVAWPDSLAAIHDALDRRPVPPDGTPTGMPAVLIRPDVPTLWASVPAIVVPSAMLFVSHLDASQDARALPLQVSSPYRSVILLLDGDYLRGDMLPALAQQHFQGTGDGIDYQLAVVPSAGGAPPVYHSVRDFAPRPDAAADARVDLFQVRPKDFDALVTEVTRFVAFSAIPRGERAGRQTQMFIRQSIAAPPKENVTIPPAPFSIVLQSGPDGPTTAEKRIGTVLSGAAASLGARTIAQPPAQWRLLVQHPSGSLERAVNAARRRNLVISSSILGILGLSVAMLVASTRRAHALARQQLEFVATVSHELRTPLAVIRSAADNLADGVVDDESRVRQYGQLVRREGLRLTDLVEQILEFAGLQSGQRALTPRPVVLAPVLEDVAATAEATAPAGVAIDVSVADNLPAVAGDEAALRRAFQNLVGNAVKYGAEGAWVGIRAASAGAMVEVSVSDRGIGIAAGDQARIFDPFYRAPSVVAAQIHGAGLGLSLVKRIVDAHGGRISLTSAPGQGSTFTVSLPVASGDTTPVAEGVGAAAAQPS